MSDTEEKTNEEGNEPITIRIRDQVRGGIIIIFCPWSKPDFGCYRVLV
jgi:hypothetical protein